MEISEIEELLKLEKRICKRVKEKFGVSRHDLLIIICCRSMAESLYSLENTHELDRGLTMKRLKVLESYGFIERKAQGKRKIIKLTERAQKVIEFMEGIEAV